MYIEDVITLVTDLPQFSNLQFNSLTPREHEMLVDFDLLFKRNISLTEKQASMSLRILNKMKNNLKDIIPNIDSILDDPKWKNSFRILSTHKRITIDTTKDPLTPIFVEFPYDSQLVEMFKKRNQNLHSLHKGVWDSDKKGWVFPLSEKTISWLGDTLIPRDFEVDEQFLNYYNSIIEIYEEFENQIPILVSDNDQYFFKNTHKNIPQLNTTSLIEALFIAKQYGITVWDDTISNQIKTSVSSVVKTILDSDSKNKKWINSNTVEITQLDPVLQHGGPVLIIIPGGSELELTKQWVNFAYHLGIKSDEMSVLFRLPNEQSKFNQYVKNNNLNSPLSDTTRIVFVSTKITKPLVKSGIKFNTIINLGHHSFVHFTMTAMADNVSNFINYSAKEPFTFKSWRQQEL